MSLLKAFRKYAPTKELYDIADSFRDVLEEAGETLTKEDMVKLVGIYGEYGAGYMFEAATTLDEPYGASMTMKFMNSYIAEGCREAGLHYFNKEHGFSIVDKVVQANLDAGTAISPEEVEAFIDEIEESYVEEEEEDTEE